MLRLASTVLIVSLALPFLPLAARAHDPDHPRGRHHPPVPSDERYRDQDAPYAHERHWSPVLDLAGGYFAPWQGDGGEQAQIGLLARSPSGRFRIGAEFIYRDFETRLFDVEDVDIDAYQVNLVVHWVTNPGGFTPYIGGGLGLHLNDVRRREVEASDPAIVLRDDVGLGYGVFGLLGLEIPLGEQVSLFAEGRINFAMQATGDDNHDDYYADYYHHEVHDVEIEDFGGGSGVLGVRIRF